MAAVLRQQLLLDVIELLAQVHIVAVGVVEALDLVPERIDLRGAVGADLLERGLLVNQLAVFEDRHKQLARLEVIDLLALPGRLGVEDGHFVAVVHRFVVNAQVVRDGLARVAAVEAVELLEVRRGDLADVLADLDLGDYIAVLILYGDENTGSLRAVMSRSPTPNESIFASCIHISRMMYSSSELETVMVAVSQPASSSISRALRER